MANTAAQVTVVSTEEIIFAFEKFTLARGMSFKLDYIVETGLEWFGCYDEALERYQEWGMDALMDFYDPDGHNLYARVLGQDNTADRNRTFDGCKKYLEDQLRAYTDFAYTALRKLNRFSGENRKITGGFIYPPHDGSTPEKRYSLVKKFVSDLDSWYGEDVGKSSFEKILSIG